MFAGFELEAPKAVIKGAFNKSYSCYGSLLCYKMMTTYSPMAGQFLDAMIVASSRKEWLEPKSKCWKLF